VQVLGIANGLEVTTDDEEVYGIVVPGAGFFDGGVDGIEGAMALGRREMLVSG